MAGLIYTYHFFFFTIYPLSRLKRFYLLAKHTMGEYIIIGSILIVAIGTVVYFTMNSNKNLKQQGMLDGKLISASCRGDKTEVKKLLEEGAHIDSKDKFGRTALMGATGQYDKHTVEILLKYGANPDIPERDGMTPLIQATINGDEKTVKILLEYGANPNIPGQYGFTALMFADNAGNNEMAKLLSEYGAQ